MTILYVTNKPAYPIVDGGCYAIANFLKTLNNGNINVLHYALSTHKHPFDKNAYPYWVKKENLFAGKVDTELKIHKAIPYLFNAKSYNIDRFYNPIIEGDLIQVIQNNQIDSIILDSLFTTVYLDALRAHYSGKIFVRTHNVESDIWLDLAQKASGPKRFYLKRLQKDLFNYEVQTLQAVDGILALSQEDIDRFINFGIHTPSTLLNVSIETQEKVNPGNNFYFLGAMNWQPNIEAAKYLLRIFPKIRQRATDAMLFIGGKHSKDVLKSDIENGIQVEGFIDDLSAFYERSGILISPILSGSGIRIKILEAMAAGIAVISTTKGASGIDFKSSKVIRVADNEEEFIQVALELHSNEQLRIELGQAAKAYIRSEHNAENIIKRLIEFISRA